MTQSSSGCSVSSLTQRLRRQSLQDEREEKREGAILFGLPRPTPNGRRCELGVKARSVRQKTSRPITKEPPEPIDLVRKVTDENVGPEQPVPYSRGTKREEISPPKHLPDLVPRPMQSAGLPSMSVRAFPTGRSSPHRELSLSAREPVLRPHCSPPLAPPLKRFCRSLTEDLPRPTPRRPVLTAAGHANADYLRSLIARRLRSRSSSTSSSFSSSRSSFRRWSAVASSGYSSCVSLPEAESESAADSKADQEKCKGEERIQMSQTQFVQNPTMTRRSDFFHGGRSFLCGLPELQQQNPSPVCPSWLCATPEPFPHKVEQSDSEDEEEEEERTLCEDTRWSSPCGLEGLDLDSMEKDDSWKL